MRIFYWTSLISDFIGLYSSAVSISQDSKLRASIRKSVASEVRFIGNIGEAEMDRRIVNKVFSTSKKFSNILPEYTFSPNKRF
jgi:hypothetical protein